MMNQYPFREFVAWEGNAIATEQKVTLEAQRIIKIVNTGAQVVTFDFDHSIDADDNEFGLARARDLLVELMTDYIAHCSLVGETPCHTEADTVNNDPTVLASSDLVDMIDTANSWKAKFNAHDAENGTYHAAAGTAHQISSADATNLPTLITLLNECRDDFEAHRVDDDAHGLIDTTNVILTASAYSGAFTLAQNATFENVDLAFTDLYFKAASGTNAIKFWGLKP